MKKRKTTAIDDGPVFVIHGVQYMDRCPCVKFKGPGVKPSPDCKWCAGGGVAWMTGQWKESVST